MRNLGIIGIVLLLSSLAITTAFAGRHGPMDHGHNMARLERISRALDLSSQQEADIKAILTTSREETRALREAARATREEIRDTLSAADLDEARLQQLVRDQAERRTKLMVASYTLRTRINQVLTPEQQEKRDALRQHRMEHRALRRGAGLDWSDS